MTKEISGSDNCNSANVKIESDTEIVTARRLGRAMAEQMGFSTSEATLVATAISELARNIVNYAGKGEVVLRKLNGKNRVGISIIAKDEGPGIHDIQLAIRDGYSTTGSLGMGLPGVKNIMDDFDIDSRSGSGTTVTVVKWKDL